jgi:hypothetical protein
MVPSGLRTCGENQKRANVANFQGFSFGSRPPAAPFHSLCDTVGKIDCHANVQTF